MELLTLEQFQQALPDKMKKSVNQELVDSINQTLGDPESFEYYRNNLLSYTKVIQDGRFKIQEYINAVRYVSFTLMGCSNIDAYSRTFPDKIQRFSTQGVAAKDVASYVTAYNKSKLVNLIYEQSLIPSYVLNQDLYQKALNVQAELMVSAKSEKVRCDAANSLLTQLKMPEVKKVELDIGVKDSSAINALRETTMELVKQQAISERSQIISTYALCGFSNIGSIGIQIGGIGAMAPQRQGDLARLGVRAMIAGSLACFMTACIAGMLI